MKFVSVNCGAINVDIPVAELKPCPGDPGLLYHPTLHRGRLCWSIVIDAKTFAVIDPDSSGRFRGKTMKTLLAESKPAPKKGTSKKN